MASDGGDETESNYALAEQDAKHVTVAVTAAEACMPGQDVSSG